MNKNILHSFTERDSARALLPPDKLLWRAQRRNTPAGMRFREDLRRKSGRVSTLDN
jgi:hypothetical protein